MAKKPTVKILSITAIEKPVAQRYCIVGDDSGHEYFIPVGQEEAFEEWVEAAENYDQDYEGPDFEENRIDGHFTFTDPRCE